MAGGCTRLFTRLIGPLLVLLLLGGFTRSYGDPARAAQPGDIGLTITFLTRDGAVAAHEPLLARIELVNNAEETVNIALLSCLELCDSDGKVVAAIPRPKVTMDFMYGARSLKPGEKYTRTWVISALYQFDKPGTYTLHVHWLYLPGGKLMDLVAGTADIRALPFDEARVTARCEELYQPMYSHQKSDIDLGIRARALYSVRHDLALPYLDWMAREWGDANACYAMRQIGTPQAKALLDALAKRQDDAGKAARAAMTRTHTISMSDVGE